MTMGDFRRKYGHQASGLRLLIDELIVRALYKQGISEQFQSTVNDAMQDLQTALIDSNLVDWRA